MREEDVEQGLTQEERLRVISYQFVSLYEQWSEDRKMLLRQAADIDELIAVLKKQAKHSEFLSLSVRDKIERSIEKGAAGVAKTVSEEMTKEAVRTTERIIAPLSDATDKAWRTLRECQIEITSSVWKIFGIPIVSSIIISLIIVFFLMPTPKLALTDKQISYAAKGIAMEEAWPKLSQEEQHHWRALNLEIRKNWSKEE
jgi:hypothetical protein